MSEDTVNVKIWRAMLKQGVDKDSVLQQAQDHLSQVQAIKQSDETRAEIQATEAFIKEHSS